MKKDLLQSKLYLYLTEFFAGVSVMAVELAASRFMAPYFSSSQIVYTIIIGTVMIAMALGNLYGGRSADKDPDPARLYKRMLIAAAWIAAIPVLGRYVIIGITGLLVISIDTGFLTIAAFATCMVIFVFPLFLLGTVTPSLVRYIMQDAKKSGEIVGNLEACNTIGSIIGTFLPTFVTIPAVGTAATFIIFSSVLALISLLYFASVRRERTVCIVCGVIIALCLFFGTRVSFAFWDDDLSYEGESVYNYLQVKEDEESISLSTNVLFGVQSIKMKTDELTGMYYDWALAAPAMVNKSEKPAGLAAGTSDNSGSQTAGDEIGGLSVLVLGNGTGTFASQCLKYYPGCTVDAVEIDGSINRLAREYFDLPGEIQLYEYDGRAFLQAIDKKYDVIQVDAYQDITIPFQMSSVEFFSLVKDHLKDGGIMTVNMNMHSDGEESINSYLTQTICSVFDCVYSADVPYTTNKELFACCGFDLKEALAAFVPQNMSADLSSDLSGALSDVYGGLKQCSGGDKILTDDKAPVEVLGMKMIDSLIQSELGYYKYIYKEKGLRGMIEDLM